LVQAIKGKDLANRWVPDVPIGAQRITINNSNKEV